MMDELQAAINCLPELYQPLFGREAEGLVPRRACADRLRAIADAISPFELDPAVIVDVGAAQGYFTLALAERFPQHRFVGLDSLEENVAVSNLLNDMRVTNAEFRRCEAHAGTLAPLLTGRQNCVLLLNVLHHVCTQHGWIDTDRMLAEVAENADLAIVELASAAEGLDWTRDLPRDDSAWLERFKFVRTIGSFETHIPGCHTDPVLVQFEMGLCRSRQVRLLDSNRSISWRCPAVAGNGPTLLSFGQHGRQVFFVFRKTRPAQPPGTQPRVAFSALSAERIRSARVTRGVCRDRKAGSSSDRAGVAKSCQRDLPPGLGE